MPDYDIFVSNMLSLMLRAFLSVQSKYNRNEIYTEKKEYHYLEINFSTSAISVRADLFEV